MSNPIEDDEQSAFRIQREVGIALRLSFETMTSEPLPEQMTLLLLRLALAQAMRMASEDDEQLTARAAGAAADSEFPAFAQFAEAQR